MVKAKVIVIDEAQNGHTSLPIAEYEGYDLIILRGGLPMIPSAYSVRPGGGFDLTIAGDKLLKDERLVLFPQPALPGGRAPIYATRQYPHSLIAVVMEDEAERDENGDWIPSNSSLISQACRAEPNGKGGFLTAADGKVIHYEWIIYMPIPDTELKPGTPVTVEWNGDEFAKGIVKRYSRGQFNARVWL